MWVAGPVDAFKLRCSATLLARWRSVQAARRFSRRRGCLPLTPESSTRRQGAASDGVSSAVAARNVLRGCDTTLRLPPSASSSLAETRLRF